MMNKPFTASNYFVAQNNRNNDNTNRIVRGFCTKMIYCINHLTKYMWDMRPFCCVLGGE